LWTSRPASTRSAQCLASSESVHMMIYGCDVRSRKNMTSWVRRSLEVQSNPMLDLQYSLTK
jgi:hypothetical protein